MLWVQTARPFTKWHDVSMATMPCWSAWPPHHCLQLYFYYYLIINFIQNRQNWIFWPLINTQFSGIPSTHCALAMLLLQHSLFSFPGPVSTPLCCHPDHSHIVPTVSWLVYVSIHFCFLLSSWSFVHVNVSASSTVPFFSFQLPNYNLTSQFWPCTCFSFLIWIILF